MSLALQTPSAKRLDLSVRTLGCVDQEWCSQVAAMIAISHCGLSGYLSTPSVNRPT